MKNIKGLVFVIMLLCEHLYGMDPGRAVQAPIQAPVKAYLLPEDQEAANREFLSLLDSSRREVLIAMYWITDEHMIDKIFYLRKKGINVQVIFDESFRGSENLMDRFLKNNILPIVFPSEVAETLMHNKFLVIDNQKVWTGSANFTQKAMDPESKRFNHENIVVIDSQEIAKKFVEGFNVTKGDAFSLYIKLLADNRPNVLPRFVTQLSPILYQTDPHFKEVIKRMMPGLDASQKTRLKSFFPELEERPQSQRPPTGPQRAFLEAMGLFTPGMSYEEAYRLIGQIKQHEERPQSRPASDWQKQFLQERRSFTPGMSYEEAYLLIGQIQEHEERPQSRPASDWQKQFLQERRSFTPGMSYEEAYRLIGRIQEQH